MLKKYIVIFVLCLHLPLWVSNAQAAGGDEAHAYVDSVGQHVLQIVNGSGSAAQKQPQLQQIFSDNVDMAWMAQFVLGRGWQQASADERTRYIQAYQNYLLAHYTSNFTDYAGSKYTITDVKSEAEGQFTVNMQIKSAKQSEDTSAGYRLRTAENGQFKIIDIIIEGVSLITTQRSDFSAIFQQKGIDGLINALNAKTQAESKSK